MAWRKWLRWRDRHAEVDAEIDAHLRMAIQDRQQAGEAPDQARRNAHLEFGSVRIAKEDARAVWGWTAAEQLLMDVRSGARILTQAPALSLSAILLIALVIGGNTTIYSAVHAMLTKPAPGVRADNLASIGWLVNDGPIVQSDTTLAHYEAIAEESRLLRAAAFRIEPLTLTQPEGTFAVRGASVTPNYFEMLGIALSHGRAFVPSDAKPAASGVVVVISARLWERQFASAPDVLGRAIAVDGHPATIVGIAPPPFQGAWLAEATDIWVPLGALALTNRYVQEGEPAPFVDAIIARRSSSVSVAEAEAELRSIAQRVHESERADAPRYRPVVIDYTGVAGRDNLLARYGPRFLAIFSIVTVLTVCIVCANVANLMLARAVSRQREMAVRQSFGASRWRITRLVLAENLTLSLVAWFVACLFAYWMARLLPDIIPASESGGAEVLFDFTPDWYVLAYAMLLAVAAAVTFTIAPAIRTWRQDLLSFLKAGERSIVQGRTRAARVLVVSQLALSAVLLIGAGLAYRSLSLIATTALGFPTGNMLLVTVDAGASAPKAEAHVVLLKSLLESVRAVPGVAAASHAWQTPSAWWPARHVTAGPASQPLRAEWNEVGPGYLQTLGLSLLHGTEFENRGRAEVIVNQNLAEALASGESPIGKMIRIENAGAAQTFVIVGVAPNALIGGYRREARPYLFLVPSSQTRRPGGFTTFYVRYRGSLEAAVPAVTRAMRETAPSVPVTYVRTLDGTLRDMTWIHRTLTLLLVLFAAGSLFIAALGQYAAMAFAMRQRVRDYAIRMAMGASSRQVLASAMREGLMLTAAGLALGFVLGSAAGRAGASLLHGITPTDAATYGAVLAILGAASLIACYVPALRSSRVNPIDVLRSE